MTYTKKIGFKNESNLTMPFNSSEHIALDLETIAWNIKDSEFLNDKQLGRSSQVDNFD